MSPQETLLLAAVVLVLLAVPILAQMRKPDSGDAIDSLKLWVAQGFGVGSIPVAPGTFGSLLGVAWFAALVLPGNPWVFAAGLMSGAAASVWLCGEAERILGRTDPGSVVLDEIAATPACFVAWIAIAGVTKGAFPGLEEFFSRTQWPLTLGVFAAFRFFDVVKPWPVRGSQKLPGGWGVTVDDFLAAVYVNLVAGLVYAAGLALR